MYLRLTKKIMTKNRILIYILVVAVVMTLPGALASCGNTDDLVDDSHLDFSFKIKAANTILSAYSDEEPAIKKESELSLLEKASQEMKALGFTSIEEYLAYKAK